MHPRFASSSLVLASVAAALAWSSPTAAQPKAVERLPTVTVEVALTAAQAALAECRKRGATVAVAVVDRSGVPLAVLRDPLAGMHTPDTAVRKAWTAASFRSATTDLIAATAPNGPNAGLRHLPGVAVIGGGLMLQSAGSLVGAIGVSGAPSGELDDVCARAGIQSILEALELG